MTATVHAGFAGSETTELNEEALVDEMLLILDELEVCEVTRDEAVKERNRAVTENNIAQGEIRRLKVENSELRFQRGVAVITATFCFITLLVVALI